MTEPKSENPESKPETPARPMARKVSIPLTDQHLKSITDGILKSHTGGSFTGVHTSVTVDYSDED